MITSADIARQVTEAIEAGAEVEQFDVDGIVATIIRTYGLVDIDTVSSDEFWGIVFNHDSTQGATVTLASADDAESLRDLAAHGSTVEERTVSLTPTGLAALADLDDEHDGHFDGTHIWVGGTEYAVVR